jgi:nitroimidazol reductase NimA-like FMN-containing flavoprotein (pyridoxamine 5'-phosphate oxidase superfamily)
VRDACLEELTDTECHNLLAERHLGRLAEVDAQDPVIFPVNYVFDQGSVVFRTDPGAKLDAAADDTPVAFEVDAVDEGTRTGSSVVVRGCERCRCSVGAWRQGALPVRAAHLGYRPPHHHPG